MKKVVLITGANGMLAKQLAEQLEPTHSVRFLTRKITKSNEYLWDINNGYIDPKVLIGVHSIIHLAGSSIADKRWSKKRKEMIVSSRVESARLILKELKKRCISVESFISASAIGYYGTGDSSVVFDEKSPKGKGFLSDVCKKWEEVAYDFKSKKVANRVAVIRIGVILAKNGGALKKMIQPIKYGLGSRIGNGKQYMPWIHIYDLVSIFKFVLNDDTLKGTFNAVSPHHINNMQLTRAIAQRLKKPLLLPNVPKFIMQILFGEMSSILLEGNKVSSNKIIRTGFLFKYKKITDALKDLYDL